jgi:hypothetical protein
MPFELMNSVDNWPRFDIQEEGDNITIIDERPILPAAAKHPRLITLGI